MGYHEHSNECFASVKCRGFLGTLEQLLDGKEGQCFVELVYW